MTRSEYIKAVEAIVREMFAAGTPEKIAAAVRALRRRHGQSIVRSGLAGETARTAQTIIYKLQGEAHSEFVQSRVVFHEFAKAELTAIYDSFDAKVFAAVSSSLRRGVPAEAVLRQIKRMGRTESRHIGTVANTIEMSHARLGAVMEGVESGVRKFRYEGPAGGARSWCQKMLGKVLDIDEISELKNDYGQSALYFCGGWNCRHRWEPVVEDSVFVGQLEELKNKEIDWREKDFRSDSQKHLKHFGVDADEYRSKAIEIVRRQSRPHVAVYKGVNQFLFFDESGVVVCDIDGNIRGYYHSGDIEKTIEKYFLTREMWKI